MNADKYFMFKPKDMEPIIDDPRATGVLSIDLTTRDQNYKDNNCYIADIKIYGSIIHYHEVTIEVDNNLIKIFAAPGFVENVKAIKLLASIANYDEKERCYICKVTGKIASNVLHALKSDFNFNNLSMDIQVEIFGTGVCVDGKNRKKLYGY